MALYSLVDKPKWLTSTQKASTTATAGGWVYTRPDGTAETLVAINRMTTKMIPHVRDVATAEDAYEVGTATVLDFTLNFNRNIKSSTITSATVLNFLIDESEFTASYLSKTANSVTFRYTFPSDGNEYLIPEASSIGLTSITLNTGEHIYLDFADFNISANLDLPETVDTAVTQKIPSVSGVTTDRASYIIGTQTNITFTVAFDRKVKSSDITSASVLNFTIGDTEYEAPYLSKTSTAVSFRYTIPSNGDEYTIPEDTVIGLVSITLETGEHIYLDFSLDDIEASLTLPNETVSSSVAQKVPAVSSITTNKGAYVIGTDTAITFTVNFNRKIKSDDITSASVLNFTVNAAEYQAAYLSKTSTAVSFRYTIPSNGTEYEIPEYSTIGLTSITLNTGEHIYLDYELDDIEAVLTPSSPTVASSVAQKVPAITSVTTDKSSYTIGSDTTVVFTVAFDRKVKSSSLTSATTLDFTINSTHHFTAVYTSISNNDVLFTWTIPDPYTGGSTSTTIALDSITLNTGEHIVLDSTANTINASFTALPASITKTITVP